MNSGLRRLWTLALVASAVLGTGCYGQLAGEEDDSNEQPLNVREDTRLPLEHELAPGAWQAGPFPNPWNPCITDTSAVNSGAPVPCVTELKISR